MPSPTVEPLSIWHYVRTLGVWLAFGTSIYAAVIGMLGIGAVKPRAAKWPKWLWVMFGFGFLLAVGAAWQTAAQLRDADTGKRQADGQYNATNSTLGELKRGNDELKGAIGKLGSAADIAPDRTLPELVQGIIDKLPKVAATTNTVVKGSHNATVIGSGQAAQQQTVNAPNGIGNIGGTVINPQVNNFGPPPANLTVTERTIAPLTDHSKKVLEVHVKTDRSIPAAAIGFIFSGPITATNKYFNTHTPTIAGSPMVGVQWTWPLRRMPTKEPVPNSLGIDIDVPAAFGINNELVFRVESDTDVHVLSSGQFQR